MNLVDLNKIADRGKEMGIQDVGTLIRTLPHISAKRYFDVDEETWEWIRIKTRGELIETVIRDVEEYRTDESDQNEAIRLLDDIIMRISFLYPTEYMAIYRQSRARLDPRRKKCIQIIRDFMVLKSADIKDLSRLSEMI